MSPSPVRQSRGEGYVTRTAGQGAATSAQAQHIGDQLGRIFMGPKRVDQFGDEVPDSRLWSGERGQVNRDLYAPRDMRSRQ